MIEPSRSLYLHRKLDAAPKQRLACAGLACAGVVLAMACQRTTGPVVPNTTPSTPVAHAQSVAPPDVWRSAIPVPGLEGRWSYPAPTATKLGNGLAVYVLQRPHGPVSLSLLIGHGGANVTPAQSGLASLTAELMVEATHSRNHYQLSEAAESLGSTLVGDAARDHVRLSLDTLTTDVTAGIGLLAEALIEPAFAREDFQRLQKRHLDDLVSERQSPARLASLVGLRLALGDRLGEPVGGRQTTVGRLTVQDTRVWHRKFAYPEGVALLVVGPVDTAQVLDTADKLLGKWRAPKRNLEQQPLSVQAQSTPINIVDRPGSVQSSVFVAHPFPAHSQPGLAARQVLNNVIGGQFTSRINQNLREEHAYTYGARSTVIATRHFGLLTVSTSVETDVTAAAIREIIKELSELRGPNPKRPIDAEEFLRARTGIVQGLGAHLEDGHSLLFDLEQLYVHQLPLDYWRSYLTEVRQLDLPTIATETERIDPQRLSIVVVGDQSRLLEQFRSANLNVAVTPDAWLD